MVPNVMAVTRKQPQMISQTMGSRPRATAKRRSVAAVMWDVLPRMLEFDSRIPHSKEAMHTMWKWHNPLGNQVTFNLIDTADVMLAAIAPQTHAASLSSSGASDAARLG
jgi:hypothetical protein